jgi:uncharacterized RDD family membrane protein YckC
MSSEVETPAPVEYVGFWPRLGASMIDSLAVLFLIVPLMVWYFGDGWAYAEGPKAFVINWILPAAATLAFWHYRRATPGKMVIAAEIVDARTFGPPSTAQLLGRYAGYYVSTIGLFLGFLWIAFDPRKQGWHDKMANTVVIRKRH